MTHRRRIRFPWPGLAVASGLLFSECVLLVRPLFDGFGAGGAWGPLAIAWVRYAAFAVAVDLLAQLSPWAWVRRGRLRGGVIACALGAAALATGHVASATAALIALAGGWALLASTRLWIVSALAAAWALTPALPQREWRAEPAPSSVGARARDSAPSIAVIVLDTMRRDRCSTYGHVRPTTPNLTALAARGVRLDRAYTTSCWSLPTHASLFTGLMPHRHGAHYEHLTLDPEPPTLAEVLSQHGYDTAGFSANPLVAAGNGMARGFRHFEEPWRDYTLRESLLAFRMATRFAAQDRDKAGADIVARTVSWLRARRDGRPFFVFVNLMEAHAPYQEVPVRWRRAFTRDTLTLAQLEALGERSHLAQVLKAEVPPGAVSDTLDLVDGATAAADAYLGQLLEALAPAAIVVVLSDHGELLDEHGLWGHNLGLWEPLLRVPLVIAGPGFPRGSTSDAPVSVVDLFPTLLAAAGVAPPACDGIDLSRLLSGQPATTERVLRGEHFRPDFFTQGWQAFHPLADHRPWRARRAAAILGSRKRIVGEDDTDLGFDLERDAGERSPGEGAATGLDVTLPQPRDNAGPVATPDALRLEQLKRLGYVE